MQTKGLKKIKNIYTKKRGGYERIGYSIRMQKCTAGVSALGITLGCRNALPIRAYWNDIRGRKSDQRKIILKKIKK